jgi:cathepsin A (carboxypeptidase C)
MYQFLHAFSEAKGDLLKTNPFFIFGKWLHETFADALPCHSFVFVGESYGGHYAPATADRIGKSLNLQGLGVGNGLTNPFVQYPLYGQMAYNWTAQVTGKPAISESAYRSMQTAIPQ